MLEGGVELCTTNDAPALSVELIGELGEGFLGIGEKDVGRRGCVASIGRSNLPDIACQEECPSDRTEVLRARLRAS